MNWFKMLWLTSEEREILRKAKEAKNKPPSSGYSSYSGYRPAAPIEKIVEKVIYKNPDVPYKNIIFSNGNITVVFWDGTVLDKMNVDKKFFEAIKTAPTQLIIEGMMRDASVAPAPPPESHSYETPQERKLVSENMEILHDHNDFIIVDKQVTMRGVNLQIPAVILASFIEILEKQEMILQTINAAKTIEVGHLILKEEELFEQYHALKMFWLKLALNPLKQSREDLLVFCRKNSVRITNNGNLILYRRIVSRAGADVRYVSFVSQSYYSLKKKGADVRNYAIGIKPGGAYYFVNLEDENYNVEELIGNLQVLYWELPNYENNDFTAAHDKTVRIKIGGIYSIPDDKINLNNTICAAGGLHAAAVDYNYSGFGDTPVVVLVNPSKAITVPLGETGKLRTTEMFIACVNDKPLGKHFDEEALTNFDAEYHDLTLDQLEEAALAKDFSGLGIKDKLPVINLVDLGAIREMLKTRIKTIV